MYMARNSNRNSNFTATTLEKFYQSTGLGVTREEAQKVQKQLSFKILDKLAQLGPGQGMNSRRLMKAATGNEAYLDKSIKMSCLPNREILYILHDKGFVTRQFSLFNREWLYLITSKGRTTVDTVQDTAN